MNNYSPFTARYPLLISPTFKIPPIVINIKHGKIQVAEGDKTAIKEAISLSQFQTARVRRRHSN
jgi:hypothetical protein